MNVGDKRILKVLLGSTTYAALMNHARQDGVTPGLVVEIALKKHLGLFPKR